MRVFIAPDYAALSREAARLASAALTANPGCVLGLPTGRTPEGMYRLLDLRAAKAFGLDEYLGVSPEDPRSFTFYLRRYVGPGLMMPSSDYDERIAAAGGIDLLVAGIGTNGHIAFNEPGSPFTSRTRIVALAESTRELLKNVFQDEEPPRQGITMGIATILESKRVILLASGKSKANALAAALNGPVSVDCPASALRLHDEVIVIADDECARLANVDGRKIA